MDRRLADLGAVGILEKGLYGGVAMGLVDYKTMDGKGFKEMRDLSAELVEEAEEHIPLGLDSDLCLIDKESVDSLFYREEPEVLCWPRRRRELSCGASILTMMMTMMTTVMNIRGISRFR
jgi:hypothetical protein